MYGTYISTTKNHTTSCCKRIKRNRSESAQGEDALVLPHDAYCEIRDVEQANDNQD